MIGPMRILIAHAEPGAGLAWQRELARRLPDALLAQAAGTPDAAGRAAPDGWADYVVGWAPPLDLFGRQPGLRAIFSTGAGVDHLLRHPGLPASLPVHRLVDAGMGALMADYCLHALLDIAGRHDAYRHAQTRTSWAPLEPIPRAELPVGILGLGVLGTRVARGLVQAGFTVHGQARSPRAVDGVIVHAGAAGWPAFLAATRVLVLLAPLTPSTANLVGADALARLRPGAWLVNVARGGLVVDADLLAALDAGRLDGAVLDVFRDEPLPPSHPFWRHPKVRLTPHVSAPTQVGDSADQVAAGLRALARGEPAAGRVDRERGY
jgi:glyoxylate/hydroxypyruvate reductase A